MLTRRHLLCAGLTLLVVGSVGRAGAESPTAPPQVQAQIMARILPFERGFAQRGLSSVTILLLEGGGSADSRSAALQMEKALSDIGSIAGKPIRVQTVTYAGAAAAARECAKRGAVALYVTPGLAGEMKAIAAALVGSGVMTMAAVEAYASDGAVLGVEISAGKPRMTINLKQAKLQKLDFPSALLSLAKVYR